MPLAHRGLAEHLDEHGLRARLAARLDPHRARDRVGGADADAVQAGQGVGVGLDPLDRLRTQRLVEAVREPPDAMTREQQPQRPLRRILAPRTGGLLGAHRTQAGHLLERGVGILVDLRDRALAEALDERLGVARADVLDRAEHVHDRATLVDPEALDLLRLQRRPYLGCVDHVARTAMRSPASAPAS